MVSVSCYSVMGNWKVYCLSELIGVQSIVYIYVYDIILLICVSIILGFMLFGMFCWVILRVWEHSKNFPYKLMVITSLNAISVCKRFHKNALHSDSEGNVVFGFSLMIEMGKGC